MKQTLEPYLRQIVIGLIVCSEEHEWSSRLPGDFRYGGDRAGARFSLLLASLVALSIGVEYTVQS